MIENDHIKRVISKLLKLNYHSYTYREIKTMVTTAIWENPEYTPRKIYLIVLNRILEEKGYKYQDNKLVKLPSVPLETIENLDILIGTKKDNSQKEYNLINRLLNNKFTQKELFLTVLIFQIDIPKNLTNKKYIRIINNLSLTFNQRRLKQKEICKISGITLDELKTIKISILEKLRGLACCYPNL